MSVVDARTPAYGEWLAWTLYGVSRLPLVMSLVRGPWPLLIFYAWRVR